MLTPTLTRARTLTLTSGLTIARFQTCARPYGRTLIIPSLLLLPLAIAPPAVARARADVSVLAGGSSVDTERAREPSLASR